MSQRQTRNQETKHNFFQKKDFRKSHIFCHAMKKNQLRKDK